MSSQGNSITRPTIASGSGTASFELRACLSVHCKHIYNIMRSEAFIPLVPGLDSYEYIGLTKACNVKHI